MNENISRHAKLVGAAVVVVVLAILAWLWTGRMSDPAANLETPETVVQTIYSHCMAMEYDKTARYYLGGPEKDAGMRQSVCEKITQGRTIKGNYVRETQKGPDGVMIVTRNYRDEDTKTDGRSLRWTLVYWGGRWRVAEVV